MIIQLEKPTLRRKDMDAVLQTMADEKIGPGALTSTFVSLLTQTMGKYPYVHALRDRFHALRFALMAIGVGEGSVVGTDVLSPRFYRDVLASLGAHIQLYDIEVDTGTVSFDALVGQELTALIICDHYGNIPPDRGWDSLGIPIIEDITESFGSSYGGMKAGDVGDIVVCAFEESCVVSTAGGAAVMTNDDGIGSLLASYIDPLHSVIALPSMNAALGVVQLQQLEKNLQKRRAIFDKYRYALMKSRHSMFGIRDLDFDTNGHGFVVVLDSKPSQAIQFALRYEVDTALAFDDTLIGDAIDRFDLFPNAIPCVTRGVRFPLYPFLGIQQILQIEKVISHLP